ncbi:poly polymerase catalytic domain-containing protein [Cryomyces antarcticus]
MSVLNGCTIMLSGTFSCELGKTIKSNGGEYGTKITDLTTHLVTTPADFDKGTTKVKQARDHPQLHVVGVEWLEQSIKNSTREDENDHRMIPGAGSAADRPASKKRGRDGKTKDEPQSDQNDSGELAAAKKQKATVKKEEDDEEDEGAKVLAKRFEDGQKATTAAPNVPIDEGCPLQSTHRVYIDDDGIIYDASLNQTNAGANNNKFYRIQLLASGRDNYSTWTRWGRVGEHGASKILGDGSLTTAKREFEKKFKDKSGLKWTDRLDPPVKGHYTFIERSYEPDPAADEAEDLPGAGSRKQSKPSTESDKAKVESTLAMPVQQLMQLIFNQQYFQSAMTAMNYDANKLPLGKLSKRTMQSGYEALKSLAELFVNHDLAEQVHGTDYYSAVLEMSNKYYTNIPHSFGRQRPPIINNDDMLKREVELLDSLSDMSIADEIMKGAKEDVTDAVHPLDRQYQGLGMSEMTPLDRESSEFTQLQDYLLKTHGATHYMKFEVHEIFRIERQGELDRFSQGPYAKLQADRRLLWHGSRCTNFGGILSQGLRIAPPEAPVSGYMFGKGVYLADMSSKSANYCCHTASGGMALLLLCEAELGKPVLQLTNADYNAGEEAKKRGCHSTWGQGRTAPKGWKDAGCVNESLKGVTMPDTSLPPGESGVDGAYLEYNEFICYEVAQIRLRYLFRVHIT